MKAQLTGIAFSPKYNHILMKIGQQVGFGIFIIWLCRTLATLMTSNDLKLNKTAKMWLCVYQINASNPGNVKIAMEYIITLMVTSIDL